MTRALLIALLVLGPAVARAASDGGVDDATDSRARTLFEEGQAAYVEGDYERSVDRFEAAYALTARPELLFNAANSYERLARYVDAANALARYVDDAPLEDRVMLRKRIGRLRDRAATQLQARHTADDERQALLAQLSVAKPQPPTAREIVGVALVVVGLIAVVTSIVEFGLGFDDLRRGQQQCVSALCPVASKADFTSMNTRWLIGALALGVGAVSTGTGLFLWLGRPKPSAVTSFQESHAAMAFGVGTRL